MCELKRQGKPIGGRERSDETLRLDLSRSSGQIMALSVRWEMEFSFNNVNYISDGGRPRVECDVCCKKLLGEEYSRDGEVKRIRPSGEVIFPTKICAFTDDLGTVEADATTVLACIKGFSFCAAINIPLCAACRFHGCDVVPTEGVGHWSISSEACFVGVERGPDNNSRRGYVNVEATYNFPVLLTEGEHRAKCDVYFSHIPDLVIIHEEWLPVGSCKLTEDEV